MANANAILEKLKDVGLRHGEKAGVAVASTVFFLCIGLAAKKETISTTPEQVKAASKASEVNLGRHEDREKIIHNLEEKGIKDSSFAKVVDDQVKTALVPAEYKATREWVSPEPGAGVIKDTPVLIAPSDLYAYPGRGGFLVYTIDSEGNRIADDGKDEPKVVVSRRRRKKRRSGGMMGGGMMGGGMMGGMPKRKKSRSAADIAAERKAAEEIERKRLARSLAGADGDAEDAKTKDEAATKEEHFKEEVQGHRWVAITGVLDHARLVANYRAALKTPSLANPHYSQVDLQRKTKQPDGTWSGWEDVSSDENLKIIDNLPEEEEDELTPETVRPKALVDPLPFLTAGLWEKVHVAKLVPKEKKEIKKTEPAEGYGMMGGGMMGSRMSSGGMMGSSGSGGANYAEMMKKASGGMGGMSSGRMMGGGMMGGGGVTESAGDYWKTEEKTVMIRSFDFTVQPDTSYRYRARVVVFNPNYKREDISPGVDTKSKMLRGPWSDETDEVHMPPDVMPYAIDTDELTRSADMKVKFQVIRFRPSDGVTVTRNFSASPGEVIGEPGTAAVPSSDGTKPKTSTIDFNSHQIVLDLVGNKKTRGYQMLPPGFLGPPLERPVLTLLLRPDGSVAVHNEADDIVNEVRRDIDANYKQEVKESGKERKSSVGMGMMGTGSMMGGGMMGGGMMGGMRGGMGAGPR